MRPPIVYMCTPRRNAVFKVTPGGEVSLYSAGTEERSMITPNYPAFDAQGYLYVTDSGTWHDDNGCTYSIAPDGTTAILDTDNTQFPNGCAVSPDGRYLYMAMSLNPPRMIRFRIESGREVGPQRPSSSCHTPCPMAWPFVRMAAFWCPATVRIRFSGCCRMETQRF